ncbi:MAG: GNAT family N-acetyltransferase [Bdellovibrionales bacterium]|nr:GNAT family N-acetyltransferase [Bdellovibrionales bacterium]
MDNLAGDSQISTQKFELDGVKLISQEEALDFWCRHLWQGTVKSVTAVSSMVLGGGYDMAIYQIAQPFFFGVRSANSELVGVVSGFATSSERFRSRGLCVLPEFRGRGLGVLLLKAVLTKAEDLGFRLVWFFPRDSAFATYQRAGFRQVSDWFPNSEGLGRNCYAQVELPSRSTSL